MTIAFASAIISKHSANAYRGIAQLVEQRSPKPRAVSSKLTTPAMTHRFFGTCAFCFFSFPVCCADRFPRRAFLPESILVLSVSSLRSLPALPKGELAPQVTERARTLTAAHTEPFQIAVFCNFLKFMLDKQAFFRYNRARSGGNAPRET